MGTHPSPNVERQLNGDDKGDHWAEVEAGAQTTLGALTEATAHGQETSGLLRPLAKGGVSERDHRRSRYHGRHLRRCCCRLGATQRHWPRCCGGGEDDILKAGASSAVLCSGVIVAETGCRGGDHTGAMNSAILTFLVLTNLWRKGAKKRENSTALSSFLQSSPLQASRASIILECLII